MRIGDNLGHRLFFGVGDQTGKHSSLERQQTHRVIGVHGGNNVRLWGNGQCRHSRQNRLQLYDHCLVYYFVYNDHAFTSFPSKSKL